MLKGVYAPCTMRGEGARIDRDKEGWLTVNIFFKNGYWKKNSYIFVTELKL